MTVEQRKRKERSDKKKDCKPTIKYELYETLNRVSYITNTPLKTVGETFLIEGLSDKGVLDRFTDQFVFDYWYSPNMVYIGTGKMNDSRVLRVPYSNKKKVSLRLHQDYYNQLSAFAYSLNYTTTSGAAILLEATTQNSLIIQRYIELHVERTLDQKRKQQLKEVIKYVNLHSDSELHYPLASLIDLIVERFMKSSYNLKRAVDEYLDSLKD
ncbi:hypothetical protein BTS2_3296 [Bacillus sp. TS-2]|nr:hypothetical protein BTS2_3296 [Bacillus sp. TS-2]